MKTKLFILLIAVGIYNTSLAQSPSVKYEYVLDCNYGLKEVLLNGKWGFINEDREVIVPVIYEATSCFYDGLGGVKLNGKWGSVDVTGKLIIPIKYERDLLFSDGLSSVYINGKYGFIDKNDNLVVPAIYEDVYVFKEGKAKVKLNGNWIYIDKPAKAENTSKYDYELDCNEGLKEVRLNNKWGFINESRTVVVPIKYDATSCFFDGLGGVQLNGKWGSVDHSGKIIIPIKYDQSLLFTEGLASVKMNGKYGFIDKNDNLVVPAIYEDVYVFIGGKAKVLQNGSWIYIDKPSSNNSNVIKKEENNPAPTKVVSNNSSSGVKLYYAKDKNTYGSKDIIVGLFRNDTIYSTDKNGNNLMVQGVISDDFVYTISNGKRVSKMFVLSDLLNMITYFDADDDNFDSEFEYPGDVKNGLVTCPYTSSTKKFHYGFLESNDIKAAAALSLLSELSWKIDGSPYNESTLTKLYYAKDSLDNKKEIVAGILRNDTIFSTDKYGNNPVMRGVIIANIVFVYFDGKEGKSWYIINEKTSTISFAGKDEYGNSDGYVKNGRVTCPYSGMSDKIPYGFIDGNDLKAAAALALLENISWKIPGSPYTENK